MRRPLLAIALSIAFTAAARPEGTQNFDLVERGLTSRSGLTFCLTRAFRRRASARSIASAAHASFRLRLQPPDLEQPQERSATYRPTKAACDPRRRSRRAKAVRRMALTNVGIANPAECLRLADRRLSRRNHPRDQTAARRLAIR